MTPEKFQQLHAQMIDKEQELLGFKRQEYTQGDDDTLINFKSVAAFAGFSSEQVCCIYTLKHIQSIVLAVQKTPNLKYEWETVEGKEGFAQRIADARNYLVLLSALIIERGEMTE